jgi:beta-glucosidase-like glycosyl hydrolase
MSLARGDVYAGFTIVHLIGSGPIGSVYVATSPDTGTWVALKILRSDVSSDADFRLRLHRTIEAVARLDGTDHAVARVVDFGESQGQLWIATEYFGGLDTAGLLGQRFRSGMPHRSVCLISYRVADALDVAHLGGLIHGDVKPTNILVGNPFSDNYRVLLTDFGHGRISDERGDPQLHQAPELLTGAPIDGRADQFALAATAFYLLTGAPPFTSSARMVTPEGHVQFDTHALMGRPTGVDGLDGVFARAFALDPADRFDSCGEFVKELTTPTDDGFHPAATGAPADAPRLPQPDLAAGPPPDTPPGQVGGHPGETRAPNQTRRRILMPAAVALLIAVALTVTAVVLGKPRPHASPPAASAAPAADPANKSAAPAAAAACAKLDAVVSKLSPRQQLAQLLMVGVTGIDDARAVVTNYDVGGINIGSFTDLSMLPDGALHDLQAAPSPLQLAVSVDEEGGRVQRLKSLLRSQLSPRELVAQNYTVQQVHDIALERGTKMRSFGITVDFAPVVDITAAPDDTVIGDRSFSADPNTVIAYAGAYAQGLRDAGLLPVLKHFPGHGRASGDSHKGTVTTPPLNDLMGLDLIPYRELTVQLPVAVMVGHMEVPDLTGDDPASLSDAAYSLLRQGGYGGPPFTGIIYTDDLSSMGAINQRYRVPDAVLRALQAGADVALWISTEQVPAVLDRLQQALDSRELDMTRVTDALSHVAAAKNPELACTR